MSFPQSTTRRFFCRFGVCLVALLLGVLKVRAAEPKLEIQLVWGTNDDASPNAEHKALEESLAKKLGMFKWKKFFVVSKQEIPISTAAKKVTLSEKCEIEIKNIEASRYEINVFGKGKHVLKKTGKITKDPPFVIAGDDKNDCAWFILIRER